LNLKFDSPLHDAAGSHAIVPLTRIRATSTYSGCSTTETDQPQSESIVLNDSDVRYLYFNPEIQPLTLVCMSSFVTCLYFFQEINHSGFCVLTLILCPMYIKSLSFTNSSSPINT
jgi:hypothetical protein